MDKQGEGEGEGENLGMRLTATIGVSNHHELALFNQASRTFKMKVFVRFKRSSAGEAEPSRERGLGVS